MRRQTQTRGPDVLIAQQAGRQHGVISRGQLIELGLGASAINRRLQAGRLHRLHLGVYAVGHSVVSREGRWLAAVLRSGDGAVLSHLSAAILWGVLRGSKRGRVEITTSRSTRSSGAIHRHTSVLLPDEITCRRQIPATTLARTLLDVAAIANVERMEAAIREAEYAHRFRLSELEALLVRHPGQRGAGTIRSCLVRLGRGPQGRVRSRMETRLARLLSGTDLPRPRLNALLDLDDGGRPVEADCLWSGWRLIVELDGGEVHRTRVAFETDRERDRRLQVAGWRVLRVTWRQLDEPAALLADLRSLLVPESALVAA